MTAKSDPSIPSAARGPAARAPGARTAVADTEPGGRPVLLTRVGLQIPRQLAFEEWERAGRRLSGIVDSTSWCMGDWLVYGQEHYSDRYRNAVRTVGLRYQTLRNYAWIARRFPVERRRSALTFQHHAEVASLPVERQERLLDRAERENWNTKQLRAAIRDGELPGGAPAVPPGGAPRIAVPDTRLAWWRQAADLSGMQFERWVRATLDGAAVQELGGEAPAWGDPVGS